ncbi:MAG: hypothetical protein LAQ30_32735 [Acidobacteriia bacterium]|nr:hypothetical protein [Terriglobia bacterium]
MLGVQAEVQFQGVLNDYSNTFANVDRLLRHQGFSLFDLKPMRYSRGALPARFRFHQPCDTVSGQVIWADVLYLRDVGCPRYAEFWGAVGPEKALKLACVCELHGLADCAAEILTRIDGMEPYLDLLTPELQGRKASYREYNSSFDRDLSLFF